MRRRFVAPLLFAALATRTAAQQPRIAVQQSGVTALLQSVSAVDAETVWAGGARGTILRTIDGGTTWERRAIAGAERLEFRESTR